MKKKRCFRMGCILLSAGLLLSVPMALATDTIYPKGLMLNLDFHNAADGLIPSRSLYPLYVPQGPLEIKPLLGENMLVFLPEDGLDIPHSSLIQPDGSEWIITLQLGAYPGDGNGMVLSQCDGEFGYAIYLKDGAPRAAIRTGSFALMLREDRSTGITDCRREMATVELRIKSDQVLYTINKKRVAMVPLDAPLQGGTMPIRLGKHHQLPPVVENIPGVEPTGFHGAISSLKILRQ